MSVLTQGTHIFFLDPTAEGGPAIVRVRKATGHNPGANPADQIEETDLEETNTKQYRRGLRTPGQSTITVNATPSEPSHVRLNELAEADEDTQITVIVGWSDGTEPPTLVTDTLTLPDTRTWFTYDAYVSDFPFDFQSNTLVATQCTMQRSGKGTWKPKTQAPAE